MGGKISGKILFQIGVKIFDVFIIAKHHFYYCKTIYPLGDFLIPSSFEAFESMELLSKVQMPSTTTPTPSPSLQIRY